MIKVENGEVVANGSAVELIKEWGELTMALCEKLSDATGCDVDIPRLAQSVADIAKKELDEQEKEDVQ